MELIDDDGTFVVKEMDEHRREEDQENEEQYEVQLPSLVVVVAAKEKPKKWGHVQATRVAQG